MILSTETLAILKNFASINSNIVFRGGNTIKTMSEAKNILASAVISETLPDSDFGIYDLNEFLSVLTMFSQPELNFADDMKSVSIKEDSRSLRYFFSDIEILTSPSKNITMPATDVSFTLESTSLDAIRKAASTLSVSDMVISRNGDSTDSVIAKITDLDNSTSNSFDLEVPATQVPKNDFKVIFNVSNFKVMSGNYQVNVSSKLISEFVNTDSEIKYWIALEKTSSFN